MSGTPKPIKHGTTGGYMAHRRRGEAPCGRCVTAWRLYWQQRRGQLPRAVMLRNQAQRKKDLAQGRKDTAAWRARTRAERSAEGGDDGTSHPTE